MKVLYQFNIIGTFFNIKYKIKNTKKSRHDMVVMGIRQELAPKDIGNRTCFPPTCHKLSKKIGDCLHGIRFPQGYSSNVKKLM